MPESSSLPFVICVDDDPIQNYISERMIQVSAFADHIMIFDSGNKAFQFLESIHTTASTNFQLPDLIFLDLYMPLTSGYDLLDRIQQSEVLQQIKVLVLTASCNPSDKAKVRSYPQVIDYLSKPLTKEFLKELKQKWKHLQQSSC